MMQQIIKKTHLIAVFSVICIIVCLGGYVYYIFENVSIHRSTEQEMKTIAELKANMISQWFKEKSAEALVISNSPFFVPAMKEWINHRQNTTLTKNIRKRLDLLRNQFGSEDVYIASAKGDLLLSIDNDTTHLDSLTGSIIRATLHGHELTSSDFYPCPLHKKIHFDIITPVRDENSHTIAVLVVRDDPRNFLYPMLDAWPTSRRSAETILVRRDGDSVLYLSNLRFQNNHDLSIRKSLSEKDVPAVRAALGYEGGFEGRNYRGVAVIAYVVPIPHTAWYVVGQIDHDEMSAMLMYRVLVIGIMATGLIALLLTGLAFFYRSRQRAILHSLLIQEKELREYHEEFRTILYSIGDGVITIDSAGHIKQMNHVAEQLTGWIEKNAVGRCFEEVCKIVIDDKCLPIENPIEKSLHEGTIITLHSGIVLVSKNGKEIPIMASGAPIRNKDGAIDGAVLIIRDRSMECEAENLRLKSEEKYKIVADNTESWEFWLSPERTFLYNSPACKQTTGYDAELFIQDPTLMLKIIYEDDRPTFIHQWNETDEKLRRCNLEFRIRHADGSVRWIQHICNSVFNEKGIFLGSRGSNRDITTHKQADLALRESEQRYRTLFDQATDGIVIIDIEGRLIDVNASYAKMHGYTDDELRAMDLHEIDTEKTALLIRERMQQLMDGETLHIEVEHYHKDGHVFSLDVVANKIELQENTYVLSFHRDLSERKQVEEALRHSLALQRATLESTTDGILVINNLGNIAEYNQQFATMWNVPPDMLQTMHDSTILKFIVNQLKYPDAFLEKVNYLYHNPDINSFDTIEFIDGKTFERYSQPQRIDGAPIGRVWSFRDITERKSLERQLIQSQKMEGIGTLAGGIAHDFNNLLAMILGSAELLRMRLSAQPEYQKYVERIIDASLRGTSISRQLLTFARPYETELKPISISGILSDVKDLLVHFLPKSIDIRMSMAGNHDLIMGDAGQIHQAILNLAINASDAMINSGTLSIKSVEVKPALIRQKFGFQTSDAYVAVSLTDTGTGIESAILEKIFDPFFSTKEKGKGTGLGLSIVHGIIKNHSGFIDVESTSKKGTTFTMYFPLILATADENKIVAHNSVSQENEMILLVDDETIIREMLAEFLSEAGYHVLTAVNGSEALDLYKKNQNEVKLIITDLGMPIMSGEQLLRKLQKINDSVKVIASSGYLDGTTKNNLRILGFKEILTKPYKLQEILSVIQFLLTEERYVGRGHAGS
jgi:two-component system, cell cycle sensor histidine kinase and response regulator CckA